MTQYVRYSSNGEVRMDWYTFKALPFQRVWDALQRPIRPHGKGKVREFK